MKTKQFVLVIFLILISSCVPGQSPTSIPAQVTAGLSPTSTDLPPAPSNTPAPTATLTKTRFPTLPPPTPITPSPTPGSIHYEVIPTLPAFEAKEYFSSLFNSLGDCSPPCWGPINLGDTRMEEVQEVLGPITFPEYVRNETWLDGNEDWYLYSSASWRKRLDDIFVEWVLYGENGLVNEVQFYIKGKPNTLQHFFASYGKPDEVWLAFLIPQFSDRNIFIGFYYERENVFLWYVMEGEISDNVQHGCGLIFFEMDVWSEMHENQAVDDLYDAFYPGEVRGLREIANLSTLTSWDIDTFYEEYTKKTDKEVCISIPLETID